VYLNDLRLKGHATGSTLSCTACGASLEMGERETTLGEVGERSLELVHRTGCTRAVRADDGGPALDTNSVVRRYGETEDSEVVGACHPHEGVHVRLSPHGWIALECRGCGTPVAVVSYRMASLGADDPPEWVCPCGMGRVGGALDHPSLALSTCRECKTPIAQFARATASPILSIYGSRAPKPETG
jgi:hypothetical protein